MSKLHEPIPADFPVQPLKPSQKAEDRATCGYCGLSWDDAIITSMTPAPSARCPFEAFHVYEKDTPMKHKKSESKVRRITGVFDFDRGGAPGNEIKTSFTVLQLQALVVKHNRHVQNKGWNPDSDTCEEFMVDKIPTELEEAVELVGRLSKENRCHLTMEKTDEGWRVCAGWIMDSTGFTASTLFDALVGWLYGHMKNWDGTWA